MLLKSKDNNLNVVELQARLRAAGYYKGLIHGKFGKDTLNAVKDYQKSNNLVVDGLVGTKTLSKLKPKIEDLLFIFIHTSASPEDLDLSGEWIYNYFISRKKWSRPGYSDVFELDGTITNIMKYDSDSKVSKKEYTFGTKKLSRCSRHICYIGGIDKSKKRNAKDTRTDAQKESLEIYIKFMIRYHPNVVIVGHNQVQNKACPSFDVPLWLESIGVHNKNIAHWGRLYS